MMTQSQLQRRLYVGMDLHSNNTYVVVIDGTGRCIYKKRIKNDLNLILKLLESLKQKGNEIVGITVESTYNWYWLVDGLMAWDYKLHLAHPGAIVGYSGKKRTNDAHDAHQLAELLKDGKLPEGYIYPATDRPIRDLLRKRSFLVKSQTKHIASFENLVNRNLGIFLGSANIKKMDTDEVEAMFEDPYLVMAGKANLEVLRVLINEIKAIEKAVLKAVSLKTEFQKLLTIPGIGDILGLTIALEVGDLARFKKSGKYLSYCRLVDSKCFSNGKVKGENNRKNGNKYLAWAYHEAASISIRYCGYAKAFYSKELKQKKKHVIAINPLASKIARASYYVMKSNVDYDPKRLFENIKPLALIPKKGRGQ